MFAFVQYALEPGRPEPSAAAAAASLMAASPISRSTAGATCELMVICVFIVAIKGGARKNDEKF